MVPSLVAALLLLPSPARASDSDDVILLNNGGRVRGVVVEEDPQTGVRIKLLDGTIRTIKRADIREVRYHGEPAAPPTPVAAPPPTPVAAPAPAPAAPTPTPTPEPAPTPVAPLPPPAPFWPAPIPAPAPAPAPAWTPEPAPENHHKLELGARLGVAVPTGHFATNPDGSSTAALSDVYNAKIPILLEFGYDVTPNWVIGISAQYGFIIDKKGACSVPMSCSDHDLELGIQGQYHFAPDERTDAWLGLGIGYEVQSETDSFSDHVDHYTLEGPQFMKFQGGADFKLGRLMTLGPFMSFSLAEYNRMSVNGVSNDITATALHEWLSLGFKGTFKVGK
jgi:hypothetical protein